jgi:threonine dehydratase
VKSLRPEVRIVGVQAEKAAAYPPSLAAGAPQKLPSMATMADGIAVGRPGEIPFALIAAHVDEIITVSEDALARALLLTMERSKLMVEAAGIAALAGVLENADQFKGQRVVASLSGGNIDPLLLSRVMRTGLAAAGRFFMLQVRIPDVPGSLAHLLTEVGKTRANVVQVSHTRIDPHLTVDEVDVDLELETRGFEHREAVLAHLAEQGFRVVDSF